MRQVIGDMLRRIGVNEDSVADILVAATEACTNAVLHAGQSAAAYTVAAAVDGTACRVEVTDAGRGYRKPRGTLSRRKPRPANPIAEAVLGEAEGLTETGRGFAIMCACVDAVTFRSFPGLGTRVVLDKRISWAIPPTLAA